MPIQEKLIACGVILRFYIRVFIVFMKGRPVVFGQIGLSYLSIRKVLKSMSAPNVVKLSFLFPVISREIWSEC